MVSPQKGAVAEFGRDQIADGFGPVADTGALMLKDLARAVERFDAEAGLRDACRAKGCRLRIVLEPLV